MLFAVSSGSGSLNQHSKGGKYLPLREWYVYIKCCGNHNFEQFKLLLFSLKIFSLP